MIKLFATDLDGTLLKENRYIDNKDKKTLRSLANNGTEIVFATGRTDQECVQLLQDVGVTGHRISQNGAFVMNKNNQMIKRNLFSKEMSQVIYHKVIDYPAYYFITTENNIFYQQEIPIIEELQPIFQNRLIHNNEIINQIENDLPIAKFMLLAETDQLLEIQKEIETELLGQISSFLSAPLCLDIVPVNVNKRVGMYHLLDTLNLEADEIAVIGDSYNDIEMLKMTPHSYAMATADPAVKNAAQHVVNHVYEAVEDLHSKKLL